ncbi:unnamed protein product, partial [marine sediment metagenome]
LTQITWVMKVANVSIANLSTIFVGLSDTHGLEQWNYPPPENATIRKRCK